LEGKEIVVFYYADSYDDDCFLLAEPLNKRYEKLRRENPDFEMILISRDPVEWRFRRFLELLPPSFPVLAYGERRRRPTVLQHDAGRPPSFIAVDRYGRTVLNSDPWNGEPLEPGAFLEELEALLAEDPDQEKEEG
jgi:hypothetical protein